MSNQPQTESIYGLFYTGDGTRDGSLGGPGTPNRVISGELHNFFPLVDDDLAIIGGKIHRVFILTNESTDKISLKTSFIQELITTNPKIKFKIAISSTGVNADPIRLFHEFDEPPTEDFIEVAGKPAIPNIGDLRPRDSIGILIQMEVIAGVTEAKGVNSIFSAIGQSEPIPQTSPNPDPGPDPDPDPDPDPGPDPDPDPTPLPIYRFLSWGDNDTTADAEAVLTQMMTIQDVACYLFAGDGPYSTDSTNWINMMENYFDVIKKGKLLLSQGNHEHPESESQNAENEIEAWFPGLHNANESLEWLQARQVGNCYVIIMNSQDDDIDIVGGDQYNYVKARLDDAVALRAEGKIDWIICVVHKSWFNLLSTNQAYVLAREAYDELFFNAQVDFMFHGHNHNVHIWKPIRPIIGNNGNTAATQVFSLASDNRYDFAKSHGTIYVTNGNGGHEHNTFGQSPTSEVEFANDTDFGFSELVIQGKQATLKHYDVNGNVLYTHPGVTRGTDPPTKPDPPPGENPDLPPCPRGEHRDLTGVCVLNNCRADQKWDPTANGGRGACVPLDTIIDCGAGKIYDEFLQQCVRQTKPEPTIRNFAMVAVGDLDCNTRTNRTFEMIQEVYDQVIAQGDLTYTLWLGDYSYGSNQDCFLQRVRALRVMTPDDMWPSIGNHDDVEDGSRAKRTAIINNFQAFNIVDGAPGWYAVTLGTIRLIVMDTQSDYDEGSDQYNYVLNELQTAAADGAIKWIIVSYHKPSIVSDSDHGPLTDFRDIYHPLFDQYHVNVVLNGHNHNYSRSFPLKYNESSPSNPIIGSTKTGDNDVPGQLYNGTEGTIYVTVGSGGRTIDDFSGDQEDYIAARSEEHGIMPISVFNNNNSLAFFYHTHNGDQVDEFYIVKGAP